jgi:tetratricopeptide (TPR) repeat protein
LLERDGTYALAWGNLGLAYRNSGDAKRAEEALRKALSLEPQNVKTMQQLGEVLAAGGNLPEAIELFRKAVDAEADDAQLRVRFARMLNKAGKIDEARIELEKALVLDPKNKKINRELKALTQKPSRN